MLSPGAFRVSFKPDGTGKFTRLGLPWFAQMIYFEGVPQEAAGLDSFLDRCVESSDEVLKRSKLLEGLDLENAQDATKAVEALKDQHQLAEFWALLMGSYVNKIRDGLDKGDAKTAAIGMALAMNARAMLIFKEHLEEVVWHGHSIGHLKRAVRVWLDSKDNADEEFWQIKLTEHAFVLSQVFSYPVVILSGKAYVGGKGVDNSGGKVVDFLLKNHLTENTALIELKTPKTPLLGSEYRAGVFGPSQELAGAVSQVNGYLDDLSKEYFTLRGRSDTSFNAFSPQCVVIVGNAEEQLTDTARKRSFELYRAGQKDVRIITYDELFAKAAILVSLLERGVPEP